MKYINWLIGSLLTLAFLSCMDDKGSYDYTKLLTSSMRTPKPIIKQWCDPLMTFHKHCSCYSLLTLR